MTEVCRIGQMRGYRELMARVEPERMICYNEPFPEIEGNIVYVDYELSSWKYQNDDYIPSKLFPYICGEKPLPENSGTVIKSSCVLWEDTDFKGMGSAYGRTWQPTKSEDERFLGEPGEIKETFILITRGGYWVSTKIGSDGKAVGERHYTDHGNPGIHIQSRSASLCEAFINIYFARLWQIAIPGTVMVPGILLHLYRVSGFFLYI